MSKKSDLLLVMRIIGLVMILGTALNAVSVIYVIGNHDSAKTLFGFFSIFTEENPLWYFEKSLLLASGGIVGYGLFMKRNWGRLVFLYTFPFYLIYQYALCRHNELKLIYMIPNVAILIALACYFRSAAVKKYLEGPGR